MISENTSKYRIWNGDIYLKINVAVIDEKIRESRWRQFGHVHNGAIDAPMRKSELIQVEKFSKKKKDSSWENEER